MRLFPECYHARRRATIKICRAAIVNIAIDTTASDQPHATPPAAHRCHRTATRASAPAAQGCLTTDAMF
jgi:hypothetical protein